MRFFKYFKKIRGLIAGAILAFALIPRFGEAAPPYLDTWLYQHPEISGNIVWEFPDQIEDAPSTVPIQSPIRGSWFGKITTIDVPSGGISTAPAANSVAPSYPCPSGSSCPANPDLSFGPGKSLQWYYWPDSYKQRLRTYFNQYWNWMEASKPLYEAYRQTGQKPPGFDERFGSTLDPDTQAEPGPLPFSAEVMKNNYTHVLVQPQAAVDLYLKTLALQLVLELGDFLSWKLSDYNATDLAIILDGRQLFRYFPAGSHPWGGQETVTQEGHDPIGSYPAPPLVAMKFLMREGMLRDTRFDTVSRWLEWQRNMQHAMGNPQSLEGECGLDFFEVYWGAKAPAPVARMLHGTTMACHLVPVPGADSTQSPFFWSEKKHFTGGCAGTGYLNHRMMRQVNIVSEVDHNSFAHSQGRFVVEAVPYREMMDGFEANLPPDPAIDDGLAPVSSTLLVKGGNLLTQAIPATASRSPGTSTALANAYLDHHDNPYALKAYPEIAVSEVLVPELTYQTWFRPPPENLTEEQKSKYMSAHGKRVSLRPVQMKILKIPLYIMQYYCWKQDAGKPREQTETYTQFFEDYTPAELEATGFWTRLEEKLAAAGGCAGLPPMGSAPAASD